MGIIPDLRKIVSVHVFIYEASPLDGCMFHLLSHQLDCHSPGRGTASVHEDVWHR